jgi:hypothetical protein
MKHTTATKRAFIGRFRIRTIDLTAREWFDKSAGSSYFSAQLVINFGLKGEKRISIPFQYGYGSYFEDVAVKELPGCEDRESLWRYCQARGILLRPNKIEGCRKAEVIQWGSPSN